MERLHTYLADLILDDEQLKHPCHDVENVEITKVGEIERHGEKIYMVDYKFDVFSRLDRKWRLTGKPGKKSFGESELKPYYREIRIDEILD